MSPMSYDNCHDSRRWTSETNEYAPYYERYISLVSGDDIDHILSAQLPDTLALLSRFTEQQGDYRYAPGKWTVKEVLGHVNDAERVFAYRALRIARADQTPIEGFEQDDYVKNGPFAKISFGGADRRIRAYSERDDVAYSET